MEDLRGLNYKPVRALGEGSHGIVLLVEHTRLAKPFVMKLIQQKFLANKDVVGRFIAEAQRGAKLNHEAFAPIVDLGETQDGRTYFVMEYVDGLTLQHALRDRGAFPLDQALVLGLQLLDGLAAAHDAHLIHRDIKPANLFLTTRGRLKILDLGISKSIIDSGTGPNTAHGVAIGTPKYMSPEQAKGQPVTYATDLYAVALVLFEMVTGEPTFDGPNAQELLRHHIFNQPPTLKQRTGREFPAGLEELIAQTLRKNPADRFQTAREMQAALHAILESTRSRLAPPTVPRSVRPPAEDRTTEEHARPTMKLDDSPLPPHAFPTAHYHVASSPPPSPDSASTRPVSAEALLIGSGSTERQAVFVHSGTRPEDATARTEAFAAMTDAQPVETGGGTTRTHDDVVAVDTTERQRTMGNRPLLLIAAIMGAAAMILASVAVLIFVVRGTERRNPVSAVRAPTASAAPTLATPSVAPITTAPVSESASSPASGVSSPAAPPPSASTKQPTVAAKPKPTNHQQAAADAMNAGDLETADSEARLAVAAGGGPPDHPPDPVRRYDLCTAWK